MQYLKTLFVGIDIALRTFNAEYIDVESNTYSSKKNNIFTNNLAGLDSLIDELVLIAAKHGFDKIKIGYEATNNYGFHIPFYLSGIFQIRVEN